jgi:hypothetical protein
MSLRIGPPSLPPRVEMFIASTGSRRGTQLPSVTIYGTPAALAALGRSILDLAEGYKENEEASLLWGPNDPTTGLLPDSRVLYVYRRPPGRARP